MKSVQVRLERTRTITDESNVAVKLPKSIDPDKLDSQDWEQLLYDANCDWDEIDCDETINDAEVSESTDDPEYVFSIADLKNAKLDVASLKKDKVPEAV